MKTLDNKFDAKEIEKLVDALIGRTEPVFDSGIDSIRYENLLTCLEVTDYLLDTIWQASKYHGAKEASASKIGVKAYASLIIWKNWLKEITETY